MTLEEKQEQYYNTALKNCKKYGYKFITPQKVLKNVKVKVQYICPVHGVREVQLNTILKGRECYKCSRQTVLKRHYAKTLEQRQQKYYDKCQQACKDKGYTLLSDKKEMIQNNAYIKYLCPEHGEQQMRIYNMINGRSCPQCAKEKSSVRYRLSEEDVIKRIEECRGKVLNPQNYINRSEKNLQIACPECGEIFITSLVLFTQHDGQVCKNCSSVESMGEKRIRYWLEDANINFIPQKWFPECRDINPLPFDFFCQIIILQLSLMDCNITKTVGIKQVYSMIL